MEPGLQAFPGLRVARVIDRASALDLLWPGDGEWFVDAPVVGARLGAAVRRAVVGGDDEQRVLEFAPVLENLQDGTGLLVGVSDFVEHVSAAAADGRSVRHEPRGRDVIPSWTRESIRRPAISG